MRTEVAREPTRSEIARRKLARGLHEAREVIDATIERLLEGVLRREREGLLRLLCDDLSRAVERCDDLREILGPVHGNGPAHVRALDDAREGFVRVSDDGDTAGERLEVR